MRKIDISAIDQSLADSFDQVQTGTYQTPDSHRRIGAKLVRRIGLSKTAWLFDVSQSTVARWTEQHEDGRLRR